MLLYDVNLMINPLSGLGAQKSCVIKYYPDFAFNSSCLQWVTQVNFANYHD